jgi:hypothetical protein
MQKKVFYSRLFRKNVLQEDPEYWYKVLAETLFRIDYLEEKKCRCIECTRELSELEEFLPKIKKYIIEIRVEN